MLILVLLLFATTARGRKIREGICSACGGDEDNNGVCNDRGPFSVGDDCEYGSDCKDCNVRIWTVEYDENGRKKSTLLCDNTCTESRNSVCEDGGEGSKKDRKLNEDSADRCDFGTDCADCGPRDEYVEDHMGAIVVGIILLLCCCGPCILVLVSMPCMACWYCCGKENNERRAVPQMEMTRVAAPHVVMARVVSPPAVPCGEVVQATHDQADLPQATLVDMAHHSERATSFHEGIPVAEISVDLDRS